MKIKSRTPPSTTISLSELPTHEKDLMCRTIVGCMTRFFENPAVKADYERWKKERNCQ